MSKKINFDCENVRYLFDFSLMPSIVFNHGSEFAMAVCNTNGELLYEIMQDYYEGLLNDIKRRNIRIFDPRRIKANCVEVGNGWNICCIEMPPDINGSSPIICNAYFIAFKDKGQHQETEETEEEPEQDVYDDDWYEEEQNGVLNDTQNINVSESNDTSYIIRFFTVEEATNNEEIKRQEIYKGIEFGKRKLCEIFKDGKRKEYGDTEKDVGINLVKIGVILDAIDENNFQDEKVEFNEETGEIIDNKISDEDYEIDFGMSPDFEFVDDEMPNPYSADEIPNPYSDNAD